MRVFVYEYTLAQATLGDSSEQAAALSTEGAAMWRAVSEDFARIPSLELVPWESNGSEEVAFRQAARRADWTLVIAPEFDHLLLERCRWALDEGSRCLNPSLDTIVLCSDKLRLADHWQAAGVPTPETRPAGSRRVTWPKWVTKPRFGAGSLDTLVNGPHEADSALGPRIVQPFIEGIAASVSFLCGPTSRFALIPGRQNISRDDRLQYCGGSMPVPEPLSTRAIQIGRQAVECVPGLLGYVGVDVVLGGDGSDWAVEINPRLTTSYLGLRHLARFNLAAAMLTIAEGRSPPPLEWNTGPIDFLPDGTVMPRDRHG